MFFGPNFFSQIVLRPKFFFGSQIFFGPNIFLDAIYFWHDLLILQPWHLSSSAYPLSSQQGNKACDVIPSIIPLIKFRLPFRPIITSIGILSYVFVVLNKLKNFGHSPENDSTMVQHVLISLEFFFLLQSGSYYTPFCRQMPPKSMMETRNYKNQQEIKF